MKKINVALFGFGTVGAGVADILINKKEFLFKKTGIDINLKYIVDKSIDADRGVNVPKNLLTTDVDGVLKDKDVHIVVETIGGCQIAKEIILKAAKHKKYIVTANKALLALHWQEIIHTVLSHEVDIMFEGSVGGGVPIIKALRESFIANRINCIMGIINGTSNYILTRMKEDKESLVAALKEAQRLGYAEADPSLDIDGIDTAHKLAILVALAFGLKINLEEIYIEGIRNITQNDIRYADQLGYTIKLLAIAKEMDHMIEARVHPTLVPKNHLLASISGVFNGIYVNGDCVDDTIFYGKGAGRYPTASAVVADIVDLAKKIGTQSVPPFYLDKDESKKLIPFNDIFCRYYVRLSVADRAGVLAAISSAFGSNNISISSVIQQEGHEGEYVPLVIMTHKAREKDIQRAVEELKELETVNEDLMVIRLVY